MKRLKAQSVSRRNRINPILPQGGRGGVVSTYKTQTFQIESVRGDGQPPRAAGSESKNKVDRTDTLAQEEVHKILGGRERLPRE